MKAGDGRLVVRRARIQGIAPETGSRIPTFASFRFGCHRNMILRPRGRRFPVLFDLVGYTGSGWSTSIGELRRERP